MAEVKLITPDEMMGLCPPKSEEDDRDKLLLQGEYKELVKQGRIREEDVPTDFDCSTNRYRDSIEKIRWALNLDRSDNREKFLKEGLKELGVVVSKEFLKDIARTKRCSIYDKLDKRLHTNYVIRSCNLITLPMSHYGLRRIFNLVIDPNEKWFIKEAERQEALRDKWVKHFKEKATEKELAEINKFEEKRNPTAPRIRRTATG